MCFEGFTAQDQLRGWLQANSSNIIEKDGAICTNFVLIAEFVDSAGEWYSVLLKEQNVPDWRTDGLVSYVMAEDSNNVLFEDEEDD